METGLFVENEQKLNNRVSMQYGVRWSFFNYMGEGKSYEFEEASAPGERRFPITSATQEFDQWESIQTYNNFEPRFSIKYQLDPTTSLKASYNRTVQYIHLVSNTTAATPVIFPSIS